MTTAELNLMAARAAQEIVDEMDNPETALLLVAYQAWLDGYRAGLGQLSDNAEAARETAEEAMEHDPSGD